MQEGPADGGSECLSHLVGPGGPSLRSGFRLRARARFATLAKADARKTAQFRAAWMGALASSGPPFLLCYNDVCESRSKPPECGGFCFFSSLRTRRGVAQPGRAPGSGPGGRRFKSSLPDQFFQAVSLSPGVFVYSGVDDFVDGGTSQGLLKDSFLEKPCVGAPVVVAARPLAVGDIRVLVETCRRRPERLLCPRTSWDSG